MTFDPAAHSFLKQSQGELLQQLVTAALLHCCKPAVSLLDRDCCQTAVSLLDNGLTGTVVA
jgi:hypothetical protein